MYTDSARYKKLKSSIENLRTPVPGTLRTLYQSCGKQNCRCATGKEKDKHGPYLYWDRKIKGKTISRSVTPVQHRFIQKGIKNRLKLEGIIKKCLDEGATLAQNLKN